MQLLRIQGPEGTKRIEILPTATLRDLYEEIHSAFGYEGYGYAVFRERNGTNEIASSRSHTIQEINLKHGDMIFVKHLSGSVSLIDFIISLWFLLNCVIKIIYFHIFIVEFVSR